MFVPSRELSDLLTALCDQRLTEEDRARLERCLLADREALRFYLSYVQLHGMLHWDAVGGGAAGEMGAAEVSPVPVAAAASVAVAAPVQEPAGGGRFNRRSLRALAASLAASLCLLAGWRGLQRSGDVRSPAAVALSQGHEQSDGESATGPGTPTIAGATPAAGATPVGSPSRIATPPVRLSPAATPSSRTEDRPADAIAAARGNPGAAHSGAGLPDGAAPGIRSDRPGGVVDGSRSGAGAAQYRSSDEAVAVIDSRLRDWWVEHEVQPAGRANDAEWLRRVHLDLAGKIPPVETAAAFLTDARPDRRARMVDDLLASPEFARHFSVVWANLLIGHTSPREVNRPAFEKFLREQFHRNRPWSETVARLISAEGYEDEDGATNFLLAHVNNEAVPATAVTARVLLCEQVGCTQCHHHPTGEWKQDRFWELNAFFQQTEIVRHPRANVAGGAMDRDRLQLVSLESGGPTYFENRQSVVGVAYPRFAGVEVDPSPETNRREELARLLCRGERPQIARAFVNRTWSKLFGYGFTDPIDDMGPHNRVILPELLDELTARFVQSGFDVKSLVRWLCLSEAYQLASRAPADSPDRPELGQPPLFSQMYVRPLSAEQLFDSLLVATQADRAGARYWDEVEARRRMWLEQFYTALENDENGEEGRFDGSLSQTLVMMNGELIRQATTPQPGTVLQQILSRSASDDEKIRLLSLATLSRYPSADELAALRRLVRQQVQSRPREVSAAAALQEALRDLMWAYLNSTEFRSNH